VGVASFSPLRGVASFSPLRGGVLSSVARGWRPALRCAGVVLDWRSVRRGRIRGDAPLPALRADVGARCSVSIRCVAVAPQRSTSQRPAHAPPPLRSPLLRTPAGTSSAIALSVRSGTPGWCSRSSPGMSSTVDSPAGEPYRTRSRPWPRSRSSSAAGRSRPRVIAHAFGPTNTASWTALPVTNRDVLEPKLGGRSHELPNIQRPTETKDVRRLAVTVPDRT
jgi:hypothetical protein